MPQLLRILLHKTTAAKYSREHWQVHKMTVIFLRLQLDLEDPDFSTVEQTHAALLAIQSAIYPRKGTLRQFLQVRNA
jgi:hypothetical protein